MTAIKPTICPVCKGELEGDWVRYHWPDDGGEGHYVEMTTENNVDSTNEGMAPPAPDRARLPQGMKPALEDDVRWAAIDYLRTVGYLVYNMEQGNRPGPGHSRVGTGIGDVYFQGHGVTGWIEFKRPDGKPARHPDKHSPDQKAFEKAELENGGKYLLVESVEQVIKWDHAHRGRQLEIGPSIRERG